MTVDWKNINKRWKYLAMDKDGTWTLFQTMPILSDDGIWDANTEEGDWFTHAERILNLSNSVDYTKSLQCRKGKL